MRKNIYRALGIFSVGIGLYLVAILPTNFTLTCTKIKINNKFCTYGFFPGIYKTQCTFTLDRDIICELKRDYTMPYLHSSLVLKNPDGSSVVYRKLAGDARNRSRPNFSVVNNKTNKRLFIPNFTYNDLGGINLKRRNFYKFLKEKDQTIFVMHEPSETSWVLAIPIMGLSMLVFTVCFRK